VSELKEEKWKVIKKDGVEVSVMAQGWIKDDSKLIFYTAGKIVGCFKYAKEWWRESEETQV
jgi:hypothetical protein